MKVYFAAKFSDQARARRIAESFLGKVIVTSRWLWGTLGDPFLDAKRDLEDVAKCDVFVLLKDGDMSDVHELALSTSAGRHVEFGYAIALGKRVITCQQTNVFHTLVERAEESDLERVLFDEISV